MAGYIAIEFDVILKLLNFAEAFPNKETITFTAITATTTTSALTTFNEKIRRESNLVRMYLQSIC